MLEKMLKQHRSAGEMKNLTWHSFRVWLAMALLEAGASPAQIQALLRWQTDDSLRLYARLTAKSYGGWVLKAQRSDVTMVSPADLPCYEATHALELLQASLGDIS